MATARNVDPNLRKAITEANKLWDSGNGKWFGFLADDVVVYSIGQTEPFRGRKAYQKHFGTELGRTKRKTSTINQNIQSMDGTAVVAQTLQIVQENITANVRQSVIWSNTKTNRYGWQISHLHTALIGNPTPAKIPRQANAIRVLNERIATIAAVLGVAQ